MASNTIFTAIVGFGCTMSGMPTLWYALLTLVSIFGVATWILHNFSDKENLKRICGIAGTISMLSLLIITLNMEGI